MPEEELVNYGRVQPQAVELEESVLGAALLEKTATRLICKMMNKDIFYKEAHQIIFNAIFVLFSAGNPVDIMTVVVQLKSTAELDTIGGPYYISQLTGKISSTSNTEFNIKILQQFYIKRMIIRVCSIASKTAYEDTSDSLELLESLISQLIKLSNSLNDGKAVHISQITQLNLKKIEMLMGNEKRISGIPSGIHGLDVITNGWQNTDFIVIAGRPGMGKTALVTTMTNHIGVKQGIPIAIFSLEMGEDQFTLRIQSVNSKISYKNLQRGDLSAAEFENFKVCTKNIDASPIYIDDTAGLKTTQLRAKAQELYQEHGIRLIFFDYLQLGDVADSKGMVREQVISEISRTLKGIAKELKIPVIALSQLNRAVEMRGGDKRPQLSDLRESGAIEQDADMVIFLYRPEYYKIMEYKGGRPTEGVAELIIAKHRNGALKDVLCRWDKEIMTFSDFVEIESFEQIEMTEEEEILPF